MDGGSVQRGSLETMKALSILLALCLPAFAENVNITLAWDANPEPDVNGYRLYIGTEHGTYAQPIQVKGTQQAVSLPINTLHYAVVTAVNTSGLESTMSEELVFQVFKPGEGKAPSPPVNLRKVAGLSVSIEQSSDLRVWATLHSLLVPEPSAGNQFYRLVLSSTH